MSVAFLITSPYQVYHYKWIARHLDATTAVLEARDRDFGLSEAFVAEHLPHCEIAWTSEDRLPELDGRYSAIVCQTPILPLAFLDRSYVVAQQYSLAKERYQYGIWRSHAHLNLMYGPYSVDRVTGLCRAVAVGNPLLDSHFQAETPGRTPFGSGGERPRLLYMPTYGELSSLRSMLDRLRDLDAEVTVKLHHAEDREAAARQLSGLQVAFSDADPVPLLRDHDGVISDFSGAAFDALHARRPVVLVGTAEGLAGDVERLSSAERDRSLLRGVTETWDGEADLFEAFARAAKLLDAPAYQELVETTLVNPGAAGAACAREIQRLIAEGPVEHFGSDQISTATRRYITTNRELRSGGTGKRAQAGKPPAVPAGSVIDLRLAYRRARRVAAESPVLRRTFQALRRRLVPEPRQVQPPPGTAPPAAVPAERREELFRLLEPVLAAAGVKVVREAGVTGGDVAVQGSAKRQVHRALRRLAEQRPDLVVRIGSNWRIAEKLPIERVRFLDLVNAHWLEIGSVAERGTYYVGTAGYLTVLFVEHDRERNRHLALRKRAPRTDWTAEFTSPQFRSATGVVAAVASREQDVAEPVDVVYTWVDSGDPDWRAAYQSYSEGYQVHNPSANNEERYLDREELRYSLRTLWLFAPFVRNIYLVTSGQHPPWLAEHPQIQVVPHAEIFPDADMLPTFNSHAIESCLHRIPGLSEHFLYFNDDVFLGRELGAGDFFTKAGLAKVRFSPSQYIYQGEPEPTAIPTDWAAYNAVSIMRRDFHLVFDRRVQHVPLVLRKSVLEEIEQRYAAEIDQTRRARFRAATDLAVPSMFGQFYAVATGRAVEWSGTKNEYLYLDTGRRDSLDRFRQILRVRPTFFCLNVTRYAEVSLVEQARNVRDFLAPAFPDPAPWERTAG